MQQTINQTAIEIVKNAGALKKINQATNLVTLRRKIELTEEQESILKKSKYRFTVEN